MILAYQPQQKLANILEGLDSVSFARSTICSVAITWLCYSRMKASIELGKQTGQLCSKRFSYKTGSWLHLTWGEPEDVIRCSRRHYRCNDLTAMIWPSAGCRCNSFYLLVMCKIQPYMQAFPDRDYGIYEWASYQLIKTLCLAVVRGKIPHKLL